MGKDLENKPTKKQKITGTILFSGVCLLLGAVLGGITWVALKLITFFTDLVWTFIPELTDVASVAPFSGLIYNIVVCLIGATVVAYIISKWGFLPHTSEQVFHICKKDGRYPYDRLPVLAFCATVPLMFGASLGPEAGLAGLVVGLCYWIGDSLQSRIGKLKTIFEGKTKDTFAEIGVATVLSVVFGAPLAGLVCNFETGSVAKGVDKSQVPKLNKVIVYTCGVIGAFAAFKLLVFLSVSLTEGTPLAVVFEPALPRFSFFYAFDLGQWMWFIPFVVIGVALGTVYLLINAGTKKVSGAILTRLKRFNNPKTGNPSYLSALALTTIAAVVLAVVGFFVPGSMLSGEHEIGPLMENFQNYAPQTLIILAVVKISLISVCFNFGWRGGTIFPIIFSGVALGFALSMIFGSDAFFAAAATEAAAYAFINRKPVTVVAILLLLFPVSYLPVTILSAIGATLISKLAFKALKLEEDAEGNIKRIQAKDADVNSEKNAPKQG